MKAERNKNCSDEQCQKTGIRLQSHTETASPAASRLNISAPNQIRHREPSSVTVCRRAFMNMYLHQGPTRTGLFPPTRPS